MSAAPASGTPAAHAAVGPDVFDGAALLPPPQADITLEEARARHPGCHIVALRYGLPIPPEYPDGVWCLLAIPEQQLIDAVLRAVPGIEGWFAGLRPEVVRITAPASHAIVYAASTGPAT